MNLKQTIEALQFLSNPALIKKRETQFGIKNTSGLGITHKDLNQIAKEIKLNKTLAVELFDTQIYEAQLLTSKTYPPKELTLNDAIKWSETFNSWEMCDSFCMLFAKSPVASEIIHYFYTKEGEFEKRTAYATIACLCNHDKKSLNSLFISFLPLIEANINDDRFYVKKGISWALRGIGKRNKDLLNEVINFCYNAKQKHSSSAAKWIIQDVLKELEGDNLRSSDYPRSIYRN